jgi:hypothetical protein
MQFKRNHNYFLQDNHHFFNTIFILSKIMFITFIGHELYMFTWLEDQPGNFQLMGKCN